MTNMPLREIQRVIASVIVISSDECMLLGRKNPTNGGVYPDAWHLPGGGVHERESLEEAAVREAEEEVGLKLQIQQLRRIGSVGHGQSVKIMPDGEQVNCIMEFNRFEVRLPQPATALADTVRPGDDLVELRWIPLKDLPKLELVPGSLEFFQEVGYLPEEVNNE